MWSKLFSRNKKADAVPPDDLPLAEEADVYWRTVARQIDVAIAKNEEILGKNRQQAADIGDKCAALQTEADQHEREATGHVQRGRDDLAQQALGRRHQATSQLAQYTKLWQNLAATVQQVERQIRRLQTQKAELQTQAAVLQARLTQAQTQKDLQQAMQELAQDARPDLFEEELCQLEAEADLTDELLVLTRDFDNLSQQQSVDDLKVAMQQRALEEQRQRAQQQFRKIELVFGNRYGNCSDADTSQKKALLDDLKRSAASNQPAKDALLEELQRATTDQPAKDALLEELQRAANSPAKDASLDKLKSAPGDPPTKEALLDNLKNTAAKPKPAADAFFAASPPPEKRTNQSVDDFFQPPPPPASKQNKLDDFFKKQ